MSTQATLWSEYWATVGNEEWLAARQLLGISARVRGFYACFLAEVPPFEADGASTELDTYRRELHLDWAAAAGRISEEGFSSTEYRLARLVAALTTGEPISLEDLTRMGSWTARVWQTLVEWGTDGRATVRATP